MRIKMAKTKPTYDYDPTVDGVSQSMIGTWLSCREKARLNIILGLSSIQNNSKPLIFGSISHGVLERGYRLMRASKVPSLGGIVAYMDNWVNEALDDWKEENPKRNTDAEDSAEECAAIIQELLPRYFEHWFAEDSKVKWMHVEDQFKVPLQMPDGKYVNMVGQFDGSYFDQKKRLCLFETKNKSQFPERLAELLPLDLQLGYYLTALAATTKKTAHLVRYNLIRRPGERRGQQESLPNFCRRIGENVAKKPDHYFVRLDIRLEEQERQTHMFRAQKLVEEFYHWWKTTDPKEKDLMWNSGSCENRYGVCGNLLICANNDKSGHYVRDAVSPELVKKK